MGHPRRLNHLAHPFAKSAKGWGTQLGMTPSLKVKMVKVQTEQPHNLGNLGPSVLHANLNM
ncbi:hypothetical protein SBA1_250012 [Candidatus Sulfotelmatobacter kueseliae]|uniref:Uncharacterized protein n=1 Tax=Candidatus Sulfotelmatobacter kueseliae TaxID=2042962 RepID=A0A2U3KHQ8_9BACT|nr:hypothetical protein SBA1_250012 [Candidatus Sulfotelmatobacter kueseliae]